MEPHDRRDDRPESPNAHQLDELEDLDELTKLVESTGDLYVRWSRGPEADRCATSVDQLTGVELPGLSANSLMVEPWWGDRPARVWIARRLYDYRHLGDQPGVMPWVFEGEEVARGPDNEPIVRCLRPIARLAERVVRQSEAAVERFSGTWGPLARQIDESSTAADGERSDAAAKRR